MRVLIVDDEEYMVRFLAKALGAEGFAVDVAYDGRAALDKALTGAYDAITLDIMLPGMNGYEVCREIRAAGVSTPVLMLTAKDGAYDEADALDIGADDFLRKPFSLVVLLARLRSLVRRAGAARASSLRAGSLVLDMTARTVEAGGHAIELTPREFSLLEYLMKNAGQALSRAQLLEHVWGRSCSGEENLADVYIGYLRKKLPNGCGACIQTVRGVGYRLSASKDVRV